MDCARQGLLPTAEAAFLRKQATSCGGRIITRKAPPSWPPLKSPSGVPLIRQATSCRTTMPFLTAPLESVDAYVAHFSSQALPVLRTTVRTLETLRADRDR